LAFRSILFSRSFAFGDFANFSACFMSFPIEPSFYRRRGGRVRAFSAAARRCRPGVESSPMAINSTVRLRCAVWAGAAATITPDPTRRIT
jgi:hypothetical protein